jgi:hypothetical protein
MVGFVAFLGAPSARAGVLSLDGIDGWVELNNADGAIPSGADPFTTEAWVNPIVHSNSTMTFWGNQAGNQANGFRLKGGGTTRHYFWGNDHDTIGTGDLAADTGGPNSDGWHHLAITWDGAQTQWYWNGAPLEGPRSAAGVNVADANHRIGSRLAAEFFHGFLDEIRIWNVARSADEIALTFDKEVDADTTGLVAYYKFDLADDYSDDTAGGHDGTPMGIATTIDLLQNAPVSSLEDSDADNLPDAWELRWASVTDLDALNGLGAGPGPGAGTGDLDGDGLTDAEEFALGLDPTKADTDGDGLDDDAEINIHGTNPKRADSDDDGLTDGEEINTHNTDPLDADSDDDFINDGAEIANNTDPNDAGSPSSSGNLGALCLDGTSFVTFTNDAGLIPSGDAPFTIESWINPTSIPAGGANGGQITFWGTQGPQSTSNGFRLRGSGGVRHYFWGNDHDEIFGDDILHDASGPVGDGWHHLAITYDGTQTVWYWNGAPLGIPRAVSGVNVADQNHRIGSRLNAEFFDGWIDELRIWDVARTGAEIADNFTLAIDPGTPGLVSYWDFSASYADITGNGHDGTPMNTATISPLFNAPVTPLQVNKLGLAVRADGDNLDFTWESEAGKLYNLLSAIDPSADPKTWAVWNNHSDMAATPDENILTIPRPADEERYFVIQEFDAPPTTLYFEDFELGDAGWTTGGDSGDDPGTAWALGTPSNVGPDGAASGDFCFGTNISEGYNLNALIWLRSPPIDLSGMGVTEAFLSYAEARDIEFEFDRGSIVVLDAADDSEIAVLVDNVDDTDLEWKQAPRIPVALPPEALNTPIKLEFRFESDFLNPFPQAGWYIDDVRITD